MIRELQTKRIRVSWVLSASTFLLLVACGGPLKHTLKPSLVPEDKRAELEPSQLETQNAEAARDAAQSDLEVKKQELKDAKIALKERESDIKIAKATHGVEGAKADAGRGASTKTSKAELKSAKIRRDIAEAQLELDEEELELAEFKAKEAKVQWLVALANYEEAKAERIASDDPKIVEKKRKVSEQLTVKQEDLKEASAAVAKQQKEVDKALDRVEAAAN